MGSRVLRTPSCSPHVANFGRGKLCGNTKTAEIGSGCVICEIWSMTEIRASGGAFPSKFPSKHATDLSLIMSAYCKNRYHPHNVLLPLVFAFFEDNNTLAHSSR